MAFRTSSFTGGMPISCVEVDYQDGNVVLRDSKDKSGPTLSFLPREWEAFIKGVHNTEFELDKVKTF